VVARGRKLSGVSPAVQKPEEFTSLLQTSNKQELANTSKQHSKKTLQRRRKI